MNAFYTAWHTTKTKLDGTVPQAQHVFIFGELVERLKAAVLKTVDGVVPHPRVRIPDSPP